MKKFLLIYSMNDLAEEAHATCFERLDTVDEMKKRVHELNVQFKENLS